MEGNVRRRTRAAASQPVQPQTQAVNEQRQEETEYADSLMPAYQRRQATAQQPVVSPQPVRVDAPQYSVPAYQRRQVTAQQPVVSPQSVQTDAPQYSVPAYQRRQATAQQPVVSSQPVQADAPQYSVPAYQRRQMAAQQPVVSSQPVQADAPQYGVPAYQRRQATRQAPDPVTTEPTLPAQPVARTQRRRAAEPVQVAPVQVMPVQELTVQVQPAAQETEADTIEIRKPRIRTERADARRHEKKPRAQKAPAAAPVEEVMDEQTEQTVEPKPKNKWIAFILCLLGGFLGLHKFYEGRIGMGIVYMLTVGFGGVGVLIDMVKILFKPTVYYVEKKPRKKRKKLTWESVKSFRYDIIGYVCSGVGGVILLVVVNMIKMQVRPGIPLIVAGVALLIGGFTMSYLNTRNLKSTLIVNGLIALGIFAFLLLFAIAVFGMIAIIVGFIFNINVLGFIVDLFSSSADGDTGAMHSIDRIPGTILGDDGELYYHVRSNGHSAEYARGGTGITVTINARDINPDGHSASTIYGIFKW